MRMISGRPLLGMTALFGLAACASVSRPPGGPVDLDPPEVVSASIDTNATSVTSGKLELRFNEVVAERPQVSASGAGGVTLEAIVLVSPRSGTPKVSWHRESITIEPRGGFRPNTTYRVTLLPGLADIRGNVTTFPRSYVFSTGPKLAPYSILGRVFDWQTGLTAPASVVEAVSHVGTADSAVYLAIADSLGQFELGPLDAGRYLVRTYIDADRNRDRGVLEKWDTVTVNVTDHRPSVELLAAQRDTAPVGIAGVDALDSAWIRVRLDKPFDPRDKLQPTQVVVQRADSSVLQVIAVMTEDEAAFIRPRSDTTAPAVAAPVTPSTRPASEAAARPGAPPPLSVFVVRLSPSTPLKTGERYIITVRAVRNLVGNAGTSTAVFDGPKPPPKPPA